MSRLFFALMFVSFGAHAHTISFDCKSADHVLQTSLDEKIFDVKKAPSLANIEFTFDGKTIQWKKVQVLTLPATTGQVGTLMRLDAINELYIERNTNSADIYAMLKLDRETYEFECTK
jgi:hypothetical protein